MIEGAVEMVPDALLEQLTASGKLATIYRPNGAPSGVASLWSRAGTSFVRKPLFDARVPNLTNLPKNLNLYFSSGSN